MSIAVDLDRLRPWTTAIREAARTWGGDPYVVAALCLRQTEASWSPGYTPHGSPDGWNDTGHGYGLFGISGRTHPEFMALQERADPSRQAAACCRYLQEDRSWLLSRRPGLARTPALLLRATLAAYDAGVGNVFHRLVCSEDPDLATTHGDFAQWIVAKAAALRAAAPHLFDQPAPLETRCPQ